MTSSSIGTKAARSTGAASVKLQPRSTNEATRRGLVGWFSELDGVAAVSVAQIVDGEGVRG